MPLMPWEGSVLFYAASSAKKYPSSSQEYGVRKVGNAWAVWLNAVFCLSHFFLRVSCSLMLVVISFTAPRSISNTHFHFCIFLGSRNLRASLVSETQRADTSPQPLLSLPCSLSSASETSQIWAATLQWTHFTQNFGQNYHGNFSEGGEEEMWERKGERQKLR